MPEQAIETRVALLEEKVRNIGSQFTDLDRFFSSIKESSDLEQRIAILENEVKLINAKLVTKDQFWPIRTIVYGLAGIILMGVLITGLLALGIHTK
jgi:hypothetical protein